MPLTPSPTALARLDPVTNTWYVPTVLGGQHNDLSWPTSQLQMSACANSNPTYFPELPSDKNGSWQCDNLTGRNFYTRLANNNYLPNYSKVVGGEPDGPSPSAPIHYGYLGLVAQRYDGKTMSPQVWPLRGTNPGVAADRMYQPYQTSGAGIINPQTGTLNPYFTGLGHQAEPQPGIEGMYMWPNSWRTPLAPIVPNPHRQQPLANTVRAAPFRPPAFEMMANPLTQEHQDRVVSFMQSMPVQTLESSQVYF